MCNVPERSIILLEDIDAAFRSRSGSDGSSKNGCFVTFSGLLNALDGVAASEHRLVFMTTNHIELLDPALIRPGRVDVRQFVGLASAHQIGRLFSIFYPLEPEHVVRTFVSALKPNHYSMAQIQAHFVLFKDDAKGALDNINLLDGASGASSTATSSPTLAIKAHN